MSVSVTGTLLAVGLIAATAQSCAGGGTEPTGSAPAPSPAPTATVTVTATATQKVEATSTETREVQVTATETVRQTVTEQAPAQDGGLDTYYDNCDEARAAGAAPVREGDPGYGPHLDRDRDGVGCE
ncbi:excalibur calcium-binding domain-containing protein [Streptomonospora alba]|nr:excalibur calcium-binding domain-containing protein [Streptomonospora alba]